MKIKNEINEINNYIDFIIKTYNYYIVEFNKFNIIITNNYKSINNNFKYCVLIQGIKIIENIFIYNIYINNYKIQDLQNILKKIVDLYFKFIDQIIAMNNNINLNLRDAVIFIYKKIIDKTINDFIHISNYQKNLINIIKYNNKFLFNNIEKYNNKYSIDNIKSELIFNYLKEFKREFKNIKVI